MSSTTLAGNTDAPVAKVTKGLSEALVVLGALSTLLITLFGHDFGIGQAVTQITALGPILLPAALGLSRAIKHKGAMNANALVYAAQLGQDLYNVTTAKHAAPLAASVTPDPVTEPPVDVPLPQPPAVGADLPVETISSSLPADPPPAA